MTIGPVQLVVLGFEGGEFSGEIVTELGRLRDHDVIRLIDLLFVSKDESGEVTFEASDLSPDEAMESARPWAPFRPRRGGEQGAVEGAIAGAEALEDGHVFDPDQVWYVTDSIPNGTSAAIALLEHRWAIPVRDAVQRPAVRCSTSRGSTRSTWWPSASPRPKTWTTRADLRRRFSAEECLPAPARRLPMRYAPPLIATARSSGLRRISGDILCYRPL